MTGAPGLGHVTFPEKELWSHRFSSNEKIAFCPYLPKHQKHIFPMEHDCIELVEVYTVEVNSRDEDGAEWSKAPVTCH